MSFPESPQRAEPVPMTLSPGSALRLIIGLQQASVHTRPKGFGENPVSCLTMYADSLIALTLPRHLTQFLPMFRKGAINDNDSSKPKTAVQTPDNPQKGKTKMSTLKAEALLREFHYNGIRIPDPGPELTVEQVRDLLTPNYPEIATASVSGPEATGSVLRYTFSRAIGSKG
jgi:PRTRC genetic system protein C